MAGYGDEISSISLGSIIGGALNAIVEAQSQAANTTVDFIKSVGFTKPKKNGILEPVYVQFKYDKEIKDSEGTGPSTVVSTGMKVPLLTMVPIPFIRVDDATIDFNVKINSIVNVTSSSDTTTSADLETSAGYKGFRFHAGVKLNASISNQKKSSSSDNVVRDYSLNIHIHAIQDDMPAGVERILDLLENTINTNTTETATNQSQMDTKVMKDLEDMEDLDK